jgi:hypothetical protein
MEDSNKKSKLLAALQGVRQDFEAKVIRAIEAHLDWPYWMVAEHEGLSEAFVLKTTQKNNISRPAGPRPKSDNTEEGGR